VAIDSTLPVRRAALAALKGNADLLGLVPAANMYPQSPREKPQWPFVKCGTPSLIPLTGTCLDGCEVTFSVHAFSKGRWNGNQLIETAEDHAARIGAAIAAALDRRRLTLDAGQARARWTGSQLLQDGDEADAYHSVQNFRIRVIS
jgi:GNAT superfamily N-acetyltransferase